MPPITHGIVIAYTLLDEMLEEPGRALGVTDGLGGNDVEDAVSEVVLPE